MVRSLGGEDEKLAADTRRRGKMIQKGVLYGPRSQENKFCSTILHIPREIENTGFHNREEELKIPRPEMMKT